MDHWAETMETVWSKSNLISFLNFSFVFLFFLLHFNYKRFDFIFKSFGKRSHLNTQHSNNIWIPFNPHPSHFNSFLLANALASHKLQIVMYHTFLLWHFFDSCTLFHSGKTHMIPQYINQDATHQRLEQTKHQQSTTITAKSLWQLNKTNSFGQNVD